MIEQAQGAACMSDLIAGNRERKLMAHQHGLIESLYRSVDLHSDSPFLMYPCMICLCHMAADGMIQDEQISHSFEVSNLHS